VTRDRTAPLERLNALAAESAEEALCGLISNESGFLSFFSNSTSMNDKRVLESLLNAVANACQSFYSPQSLSRLLHTVNESGFLSGPLYQHFVERAGDVSPQFVTAVLRLLNSLLCHLPSSSLSNATLLLSQLSPWSDQNAHLSPGVADQIRNVEEIKTDVAKQLRGGDLLRDQEIPHDAGENRPPDDFRKIPTVPSAAEIQSDEPPFLRANIIYGAYSDADHYLDVQYRLLREDFVCPLREGLRTLRDHVAMDLPTSRISEIRFYRGVQILTPYCTKRCVIYRAR